jgi:hypothetical protein
LPTDSKSKVEKKEKYNAKVIEFEELEQLQKKPLMKLQSIPKMQIATADRPNFLENTKV